VTDQIVLRNVVVTYRKGLIVAVKGVSLSIGKGDVLGIIGPNGAGKTTLLKAIAKIIGYRGTIYIDGYEVSSTPHHVIARILAYAGDIDVPDMLSLTVLETVLTSRYPVSKGFLDTKEDKAKAMEVLRTLGIEDLAHRRLDELSSGELRKVIIAMALAREPRAILLDEPDAHLDMGSKIVISRLIRRISRRSIVIFTTHDIFFAVNTASKIALLRNGSVIGVGRVEDIVKKDLLTRTYGVDFNIVYVDGKPLPIPVYG